MIPWFAVARVAFKETIRSRSLQGVSLLFVALLTVVSLLGRGPDLHRFALGSGEFLLLFAACILGVRLLSQELENKTTHCVLAKPISRKAFLLGKYLGTSAALWLLLGGMTILSLLFFPLPLPVALALSGLKAMLLLALAMLLALVLSPTLGFLYAGGLAFLGCHAQTLLLVGEQAPFPLRGFVWLIGYSLPNFQALDFLDALAQVERISLARLFWPTVYGLFLIVALLCLAMLAFEREEL